MMKLLILPTVMILLVSCGSSSSTQDANNSALYDPPFVTLTEGKQYQFKQGTLEGRGQRFYSQFYYKRALTIGK